MDEIVLAVHKSRPASDIVSNAFTERKESRQARLPKLKRSAIFLAVHRFHDSVHYRRIDREPLLLLSAIRDGDPVTIAVEGL